MNEHKERKISLAVKFTVIFGVFGIVFSVLNILYTYQTQKKAYYNETENNLNSITTYLNDLIVEEGDEFVKLKNYIAKHGDEMRIPSEKPIDYSVQYENFKRLFSQKHPGKAPGIDIGFDEMDEEVKLAYAEYRFNYWRNVFEEAKDSFNLTYVYFIYPSSEDHMIYYIDPIIAEFEENGKSYIVLNLDVYQDPAKYPGMWEAWETGVSPEKLDVFNNKNGHVYTDYAPVSVNGEKVGLVCADISVQRVDQIVWSVVMRQALGSVLLIIAGVILTGSYVRKTFISRILKLEKEVSAYSGEKDPAIAQSIRAIETGNDEIRSLSDRFADMIAEITDYMTDLKRITAEKERVTAELNLATQIQADMLPRIFPPFPDRKEFDLFASMDPAKEVGGDFYDF
ncbi:MAG TPA: hypothetical protein DCL38_11155, partial [Lachnospiraceae bacterium]|nr:hypothetical protein [Lachnospiraceae bacterium]